MLLEACAVRFAGIVSQGVNNPFLVLAPNSIFTMSNIRLLNFHSSGAGAAVRANAVVRATFTQCDFVSNIAHDGGAVFVSNSPLVRQNPVLAKPCAGTFTFTADWRGAGVDARYLHAQVTFTDCEFIQNYADNDGGAVLMSVSSVFFYRGSFHQNQARARLPQHVILHLFDTIRNYQHVKWWLLDQLLPCSKTCTASDGCPQTIVRVY